MSGTDTVFLHFLGWQQATDRKQFHDSPGYFENLWVAGEIRRKGDYPKGLIALYEKGMCGIHKRLKVEIDSRYSNTEDIIQTLVDAGLNVEPCHRRHWWSRCDLHTVR